MPDRDRIADLVSQVRTYDLERPRSLDLASLEAIGQAYNGVGPEWLPEAVRALLTDCNGYFEPATLVHDWEYQFTEDRSRDSFTACNERLRRNCLRLLAKGCPWYKRWFYRPRPDLIADTVQEIGWRAWLEAAPQGIRP